jgi:acetyl-CoA C-acetyltransferase
MKTDVFIKGVGSLPSRPHYKPSHLLAYDAILQCLEDSDMKMNDVDAIVVSNLEWFYSSEQQRHMASQLSSTLKTNMPIIRVPLACSGGGGAFWTANRLLQNGDFNNVIALGVEKLMETTDNSGKILDEFSMAFESRWEQQEGIIAPCSSALVADAYLRKFPETTTDDLALIAFKNHSNGFLNPHSAFYNKKVTLEAIKNSPPICTPLRRYDCSFSCDGAAAALLTKDKTDVKLIGSSLSSDSLSVFERPDPTQWDATVIASKEAYKEAGIGTSDIDFIEIHDAFTIVELISYEDLGLAKKGEGAKLIRDGTVNIDGSLPINPSGGLKAKGHPVSATGLNQVYEIIKQMRGLCKDRQLSKTNIALAHNIGGAGGNVTCNLFRKIGG